MKFIESFRKNKGLRDRIYIVMIALMIFKVGMHVYVPFIDRNILNSMSFSDGVMGMVNTFTGGALSQFSIFAVGIMPFITASIIIQLLKMDVVPVLSEWGRQGADGEKKLKKVTYILTLVFAFIQSIGMSVGFNYLNQGLVHNPNVFKFLIISVILTLGTVVLVFLGEVIERRGIGKGISMIILAGILMTIPDSIAMYVDSEFTNVGEELFITIIKTVLIVLFVYALLLAVIVVNGGSRKIPIQSSRTGRYGKVSTSNNFLPIKVNPAGIIPVIFASSLFMLPTITLSLLGEQKVSRFIGQYFSYNSILGIVIYAVLIMLFTYFYSFVQMNPETIATNLYKSNSYIKGIRPQKPTEEYFRRVISRLAVAGALFLSTLAVLPMFVGLFVDLPQQLVFGGASLIIIVSVIVELKSELSVQMIRSNYNSYGSLFNRKGWS